MKLSVIVPAFNRKEVLGPCLAAILPQLEEGDELIVVDDASDLPVREFLSELEKKWASLRVYHLDSNSGQGHGRNHGVSLANQQTDVLVFIDSDVEILKGSLEKIRHFFDLYGDISGLTGRLKAEQTSKSSFFTRYKNSYMNYIFGLQSSEVNFLYGSICAVRSRDFIPWPEKFLGVEDSELGMKMVAQGKKLVFMQELEVVHLKNYGPWSLLKNDFLVPFGFARCFWLYRGWRAYIPFLKRHSPGGFSHIKPFQVYSLFIVIALVSLVSFLPYQYSLGLLGLFFVLNGGFFWFLFKRHSFTFLVFALGWTFLDQIVMFFGAIFGLIYHGVYLLYRFLFGRSKKVPPVTRVWEDSVEK